MKYVLALTLLLIPLSFTTAQTTGLILHLPFDDGGAVGKVGQAKQFSGTSDTVNRGTGSEFDVTGDLTISAWAKPDMAATGLDTIIARQDGGVLLAPPERGYVILYRIINGNAAWYYNISGATSQAAIIWNTNAPPDGAWHHVLGVTQGNVHKLYVDGVERGSATVTTGDRSVSAPLLIGDDANGSDRFLGLIDEVRVYNRALSTSEVGEVYAYAGGTTIVEPPPPPPTEEPPPAPPPPVSSDPASCEYSAVSAAVAAAGEGGTVTVPAGNCTWNSTLNLTKAITLKGSGTTINYGGTKLVNIAPTSDKAIRVTGFNFVAPSSATVDGYGVWVAGNTTGSYALTKIRIDNNTFTRGTRAVFAKGWVNGVVDHNTFKNTNIAVMLFGDNEHSWARPIFPGSHDAVFIENNTFIIDNTADREPNHAIYHQNGGRSVTRYNTFDASAYTNGNAVWYDSHGNWGGGGGNIVHPDSAEALNFHAQPILEVYENTFSQDHSYEWGNIRGGTFLFWNNRLTQLAPVTKPVFKLTDEESWQTLFFNPLRTVWPARQQVKNTHFWGNTINGGDMRISYTSPKDSVFIQEGRDYYMRPLQTGDPHYPYTPYIYPHPLVSGTAPVIVSPPPPPPPPTGTKGDFNNDGVVNSVDFSLLAGAWNTSNSTYDLTKDGTVNTLDYSIMAQNWTR